MKRLPVIQRQLLNDVAHSRIIHEKRRDGGCYKQVYEGVLGPLSPVARRELRALISDGYVQAVGYGASRALQLTGIGKLSWATHDGG